MCRLMIVINIVLRNIFRRFELLVKKIMYQLSISLSEEVDKNQLSSYRS
jgi:hypothetical protein